MLEEIASRVPQPQDTVLKNGIKHCAKCGKPVETVKVLFGIERHFPCICDCGREEIEQTSKRLAQEEKERQRNICFSDKSMWDWTFENDDKSRPEISNALIKYADNFPKYLQEGKGILFCGTVGTGKSYYAGCIANRLIDKGYRCKMTNFQTIINQLQNGFEGRNEYIEQLCSYSLLIIDDLGTERESEYMREQVFNIINARYVTGKPLIITTNIPYSEILKEPDVEKKRIYDRVIEKSMMLEMNGTSRRIKKSLETSSCMKSELGL